MFSARCSTDRSPTRLGVCGMVLLYMMPRFVPAAARISWTCEPNARKNNYPRGFSAAGTTRIRSVIHLHLLLLRPTCVRFVFDTARIFCYDCYDDIAAHSRPVESDSCSTRAGHSLHPPSRVRLVRHSLPPAQSCPTHVRIAFDAAVVVVE